jgi:hypothetical protein
MRVVANSGACEGDKGLWLRSCAIALARLGIVRPVKAPAKRGDGGNHGVSDHVDLPTFIEGVKRRNPGQPEFVQAVQEVAEDIFDFIQDKEDYHRTRSCAGSPSPTG